MMDTKKLLTELVSIKSLSGQEDALAKRICSHLDAHNVSYMIQDKNVVCKLDNNSATALIFNAHMDTVDASDAWSTNPLELVEKNTRWYGLGVSDEKISVALALQLITELKDEPLGCDVWFCFVINEEVDGLGSQLFVEYFTNNTSYTESACIIMEPTNNSFMELGAKGNCFMQLDAYGTSVHSSRPSSGVNAVHVLLEALDRVKVFINEIDVVDDYLGETTLAAPTTITAGTSVNTIPDRATATFDIRTTPKTHQLVLDSLNELFDGLDVKLSQYASPSTPSLTKQSERIVKLFQQQGVDDIRYATGSDDSTFFTQKGIPCVVFGAGNRECIHQADEYIDIENVQPTFETYLTIARQF